MSMFLLATHQASIFIETSPCFENMCPPLTGALVLGGAAAGGVQGARAAGVVAGGALTSALFGRGHAMLFP